MTEKVREYIDLLYGMGKLRESIDEKAEWNEDERVTEYTTMAMSALEGMTEEETKYLDIATSALKVMAAALLAIVEAWGKGGISELAAKIIAKASILRISGFGFVFSVSRAINSASGGFICK